MSDHVKTAARTSRCALSAVPRPAVLLAPSRIRPHAGRAGFSLLEVAIACVVLTLALGAVAASMASTGGLTRSTRERSLALEEATNVLEGLRAAPLALAFAMYNEDPGDDPGGKGTAPGARFEVAGLRARDGGEDVGSVEFPTRGKALREDVDDAQLGMPRDLDGDRAVTAADVSGTYRILPVRVRVEWVDASGEHVLELHTSLADL